MNLKKAVLLFSFAVLVFSSCDENNTVTEVCNLENPLENLTFLKDAKDAIDRIDCGGKSSITQFRYNSEIVFEINICSGITDGETQIYNCAGDVICAFGGISGQNTCPDFEKNTTDKVVLYGN